MVGTDATSQDPDALKALVDHYEVPILSIHAPCLLVTQRVWGTDPWGKLQRAQEAAERLGADTVVVHPPFRWQRDYAREFVEGLARMGSETDVRFAVENMFPWRAGPGSVGAYLPDWDVRNDDYPHTTLDLSHTAVSRSDARRDGAATSATGSRTCTWPTAPTPPATSTSSPAGATSRWPRCSTTSRARASAGTVIVEVSTRRAPDRAAREQDLAEALAFARAHLQPGIDTAHA